MLCLFELREGWSVVFKAWACNDVDGLRCAPSILQGYFYFTPIYGILRLTGGAWEEKKEAGRTCLK